MDFNLYLYNLVVILLYFVKLNICVFKFFYKKIVVLIDYVYYEISVCIKLVMIWIIKILDIFIN